MQPNKLTWSPLSGALVLACSHAARLAVLLSAVVTFCSDTAAVAHTVARGRLVFAYADRPVVGVLDLDSGEITHRFDVPRANPRMVLSDEGRYVFILTGDDHGTVRILDTGVTFTSHGDHVDAEKGPVKLLEFATTGTRPSHITVANGWATVFYDGQRNDKPQTSVPSKAGAIEIASLARAKPISVLLDTPGPQHGLAVALGDHKFAVTSPNPAYARLEPGAGSLPLGIIAREGNGKKPFATFDGSSKNQSSCPQLHGHASVGKTHLFGCAGSPDTAAPGGMFVLQRQGRKWIGRSRAYPDGRRVSTLRASQEARFAVGNYGEAGKYVALIRIDAQSTAPLVPADVFAVPDDQPVCQFAAVGDRVINLNPDGKLRVYRAVPDWKAITSFDMIDAFDCAYDAKSTRPSLAVLGEHAFVSDPLGKRIREFNLRTLQEGLDLPIDGVPGNLAVGD
ncbi:hypothetical protein [Bradyrhizobium sp. LHD-71]|uniref:hypothetical protein n=1 Tax=Bradyrhizobium sp. LHD-71 TaxID=3072141 RepID=UPI00280E479D|nr:hypothetical protein [Bradyrhizobium sp. LHD-71]MDQ8727163.1 hypothetical protein [Bradyrhizobium sp. LHD-71]